MCACASDIKGALKAFNNEFVLCKVTSVKATCEILWLLSAVTFRNVELTFHLWNNISLASSTTERANILLQNNVYMASRTTEGIKIALYGCNAFRDN